MGMWLIGCITAFGQGKGGFNPPNPNEPDAPDLAPKHHIFTIATEGGGNRVSGSIHSCPLKSK